MGTISDAIGMYGAVFLAIIVTGAGAPLPEEIPIAVAGVWSAREDVVPRGTASWPAMFGVCVLGVILGDSIPYLAGRRWGPRLLDRQWARLILTPNLQARIRRRLTRHGAFVLLTVRFVPGTRTPAFLMAGASGMSARAFLLVNGLAAIPYVGLVFGLTYLIGEPVIHVLEASEKYRQLLVVAIVVLAFGYLVICLRSKQKSSVVARRERVELRKRIDL